MDKYQAYQGWLEQFNVTPYQQGTVPENAEYPRMTYTFPVSEFEVVNNSEISLWYRTTSWREIKQKANEMYNGIGLGGVIIPYDDGKIWIKRGSPFAQMMDDEDDSIRRIYIIVQTEFLTNK